MPRNMRPDNLGALVLARFALDFWAQNLGPLRPKMCANALQRIDKNGPLNQAFFCPQSSEKR
eukprot:scaffold1830_cov117-Cylindrotheca_fusiformis.AAC.26